MDASTTPKIIKTIWVNDPDRKPIKVKKNKPRSEAKHHGSTLNDVIGLLKVNKSMTVKQLYTALNLHRTTIWSLLNKHRNVLFSEWIDECGSSYWSLI